MQIRAKLKLRRIKKKLSVAAKHMNARFKRQEFHIGARRLLAFQKEDDSSFLKVPITYKI